VDGEEVIGGRVPVGPLLAYAVAVFATFHLVVTLLEEPHLGRARGTEYQAYLDSVGRWMGRK
jgi:protein-S-isoprenylcysteine O-methyltransferase Ste14